MKRVIEVTLCIFIGVFLFGIFAITFQVIGGDSPNKAAIIGGILSMFGGTIGALGAYFIAKWQMNVVLERQYEKEKSKFTWEIKVNKKLEVVQILNNKINDLDSFRMEYINYITSLRYYLRKKIDEDPNIKEIKFLQDDSKKSLELIDMLTDLELKFKVLFSYKSFYSEDFLKKLYEFDDYLLEFYKIFMKNISVKNWKIESSTDEFFNNWLEEKDRISNLISDIDSKFYDLVDNLITEISGMLPEDITI